MPEQVGCRDYKAFAGLPGPFQSDNVGDVFRPEAHSAHPFTREFSAVRAGVYVIIVKRHPCFFLGADAYTWSYLAPSRTGISFITPINLLRYQRRISIVIVRITWGNFSLEDRGRLRPQKESPCRAWVGFRRCNSRSNSRYDRCPQSTHGQLKALSQEVKTV